MSDDRPAAWSWGATGYASIAYSTGTAQSATDVLDQYASIGVTAPTYDENGNRESFDGLETLHDAENRLVRACKPDCASPSALDVTYVYDALGRRVAKDFSAGGTDTAFLHAGDMEIAEYDGSGTLLRRFVPGPSTDNRVMVQEVAAGCDETPSSCTETSRGYTIADRLGHVVAVIDGAGDLADAYRHSPFGVHDDGDPLAGQPFRYTGRRLDPETGLYFYRARYYDQVHGRFLETDPVGFQDQMNLYAYVRNDPLNNTDPTGRCPGCVTSADKAATVAQTAIQTLATLDERPASTTAISLSLSTGGVNTGGTIEYSVAVEHTSLLGPAGIPTGVAILKESSGLDLDVTTTESVAAAGADTDLGLSIANGDIDSQLGNAFQIETDAGAFGVQIGTPTASGTIGEAFDNLTNLSEGTSVEVSVGPGALAGAYETNTEKVAGGSIRNIFE